MKILHVVASLDTKDGGPSRTVVQLTDYLCEHDDCTVNILTQKSKNSVVVESSNSKVVRHELVVNSTFHKTLSLSCYQMLKSLCGADETRPDIIHSHGLWLPINHWAANVARHYSIPFVIHPRGMLEPWALSSKKAKKRLLMKAYQRSDLESASAIVATSDLECQNIKALGFKNPIAVIPNGVDLKAVSENSKKSCHAANSPRVALFMSRLHPKKGLYNLLEAWSIVRPEGWVLYIAGPDENDYKKLLLRVVDECGLRGSVRFLGELNDIEKSKAFDGADLFILPTFSENFGVVVAESLAHGVPVITTKGAPWEEIEVEGCGWWVDIGVKPLSEALRDAVGLSDIQRRKMGEIGRHYVQKYNWPAISRQTMQLYNWVVTKDDRPDFVY